MTSELLLNLSNEAVDNMVTLCLGNTKVDNAIFRILLRMKKLKYLGMDETFVTSKGLNTYSKDFFRINGFKCDLRYLSIQ